MNKNILLVLTLVLAGFSANSHAHHARKLAKNLYKEAVASPAVPGISVAVADNTGLKWSKGFGYADLENKVPMTAKTKLRIGSIAKVITAAGLMRLYEQGKINLNTDIRELVTAWPDKHEPITLNHLTSHTSGIRHYASYAEFFSNVPYETTTEALNIFKDDNLLFSPGSDFRYTTFGWTLIGAVMEQADGQKTFKDIISEQVLTPLKLENTTFDDKTPLISHRQRPYSYYDGQLHNSPQVDSSYKYAGGGFLSTPNDIVSFALAHLRTDYLQNNTLAKMFTKSQRPDGSQNPVGIGWFVGFDDELAWAKQDPEKNAKLIRIMEEHPHTVSHSGGSVGGTSMLILCLEHERAVTVVKNVDGDDSADVFALALETLDIFHHGH